MADQDVGLSISAVERETGLSKDTLRAWEKRYRFPTPERDAHHERVYSRSQVEKLIVIKRLIDQGARPGKVVGLSTQELLARAESMPSLVGDPVELVDNLQLVKAHSVPGLRKRFESIISDHGLERFLRDTVAPLNLMVGDAWIRGEIEVFEEHLYTEVVQVVLRSALASMDAAGGAPSVLLTTLPGEQHVVGLLMADCMLRLNGASTIALGPQTPAREIVRAAETQRADVVGLSFSSAYPAAAAIDTLVALRGMLAPDVELWAGGSNPALFRRRMDGVLAVRELAGISGAVRAWRASRPNP